MKEQSPTVAQMIQILTNSERAEELVSKECLGVFEEPEFLTLLIKNFSHSSTYNAEIIEIALSKLTG